MAPLELRSSLNSYSSWHARLYIEQLRGKRRFVTYLDLTVNLTRPHVTLRDSPDQTVLVFVGDCLLIGITNWYEIAQSTIPWMEKSELH